MSLLERFTDPGPEYSPLPIWWWSGARVTRDRLRWQMEKLVSQGVRQAVVMCLAPSGPMFGSLADDPPFLSPEWLDLLDGACEDAAELGFHLWMYDQIGFSGANFQGRLTAANPEFAGQALYRDADGIKHRVSGFDYFGVEACAALLDQVHGTLERRVGRWFGTVIPGFFQDELPAMPTWGRDFAETFTAQYGYELALPALFEGADAESARIRRDYHEHRARLARRAFFDPLDAWFADRGLICGFDQPSPAREGDPIGGVQVYGDYLGTHSGYGAPGSDHWGDPKVHSSLAHAHGRPRTWIEAFHSSGWGGTLEETYDWLAPFLRRGANLYDPHAVYYSTVGGWWEWAPPSTCWRQPYWPSYHQFSTAVTRLCSVLSGGTHVCDTVLLSPTTTAQAYLTLDGPLPPAERATACYHKLNGVSAWFAEERGILERAGIDHDTLDENTIAAGTVVHNRLKIGDETYRTVILPDVELVHPAAAGKLAEFARAGGTVVCVGAAPLDDAIVVAEPEDVPGVITPGPVQADAPFLLRRYGDTSVLLVTAHDDHTGTKAPIVTIEQYDWFSAGFPWDEYWRQLQEDGYDFVPPGDRVARVRIDGSRAQQWDTRTGRRTELTVNDGFIEVPFTDGPMSLVVFGETLPDPTTAPLGEVVDTTAVEGPWRALAESTLDNRHGDLAAATRPGVLPIEVWRLEHSLKATFGALNAPKVALREVWEPVTASYGPFAEVRGPDGTWRAAEWSLSRGIRNDPAHNQALGPKGYVPEEFLDWRHVPAGERVAVRTQLALPDREGLYLAVGSGAARRVVVDDNELPVEGEGYQSFSPLPRDRTISLEIEFTAEQDGPLRASFAVVTDPEAYRRPEWLVGENLTRRFHLNEIPADTGLHVASEGACSVQVNGVEVGRQGDFNPYPGHREIRVQPYDLRDVLRVGENTITLRLAGDGAATVDGLGLISRSGWEGATLRRHHPRDPRFLCAHARPHPLPGAHWLEPAAAQGDTVLPIIPGVGAERLLQTLEAIHEVTAERAPAEGDVIAAAGRPTSGNESSDDSRALATRSRERARSPKTPERTEWLRFAAPLGTTALTIPVDQDVVVLVDEHEYKIVNNRVDFPEPLDAGTTVLLQVRATDGRQGGALLDAAIQVEVAETETALVSWEDLGLRALGGQVRYRTTFQAPPGRVTLDLGEVRGTADVLVNGTLVDQLVWGPWRTEITGAVRPGENELEVVIRGTLAGYLDDASPTTAVAAGQVRTGLFGPVLIQRRETP